MGKTVYAINWLIREVVTCSLNNPQGHYFAPTYKQAKSIAWKYLLEFTSHIHGMTYNKSELTATFPQGQTIQLVGSDNPDSFRGNYSDAAVLDEMALFPASMWGQVVRPALADRPGKALFIGTPAGRNQFWELYNRAETLDDWGRVLLTHADTQLIPDSEIASLRAEMDDNDFRQEMLCDFQAAVRGAYFGNVLNEAEEQGRIIRIPYDQALPVWTSWDLGIADSTAIWFIQVTRSGEVRLIDYEEYQGMGLPEIIKQLKAKPYQYEGHIAPHDIRVRELGTGTSRFEVAMQLGVRFRICRNIPLMDGIDATRNLLAKAYIDPEACKTGLNYLRLYRQQWDDKKRIFSLRPLHDFTSHAADALRMFAVEMGSRGDARVSTGGNFDLLDRMAV
jgi:hypothetical protein